MPEVREDRRKARATRDDFDAVRHRPAYPAEPDEESEKKRKKPRKDLKKRKKKSKETETEEIKTGRNLNEQGEQPLDFGMKQND